MLLLVGLAYLCNWGDAQAAVCDFTTGNFTTYARRGSVDSCCACCFQKVKAYLVSLDRLSSLIRRERGGGRGTRSIWNACKSTYRWGSLFLFLRNEMALLAGQ